MNIGEILIVVIVIFGSVTLMFIYPLMSLSERTDDISQSIAQTATSEFADKISISGQIDPADYEAYEQTLSATGNTYVIEIEVQHLDENPGKKSVVTSGSLVGENVRYSTFTTEILNYMYPADEPKKPYPVKKGDYVIITAKNRSKTMAEVLSKTFYKVNRTKFKPDSSKCF